MAKTGDWNGSTAAAPRSGCRRPASAPPFGGEHLCPFERQGEWTVEPMPTQTHLAALAQELRLRVWPGRPLIVLPGQACTTAKSSALGVAADHRGPRHAVCTGPRMPIRSPGKGRPKKLRRPNPCCQAGRAFSRRCYGPVAAACTAQACAIPAADSRVPGRRRFCTSATRRIRRGAEPPGWQGPLALAGAAHLLMARGPPAAPRFNPSGGRAAPGAHLEAHSRLAGPVLPPWPAAAAKTAWR